MSRLTKEGHKGKLLSEPRLKQFGMRFLHTRSVVGVCVSRYAVNFAPVKRENFGARELRSYPNLKPSPMSDKVSIRSGKQYKYFDITPPIEHQQPYTSRSVGAEILVRLGF